MWILTPLQSAGETHYLFPGKEYTVGRKNCDILLPSDQSISRTHAQLSVTGQTLTLKDSSKYGTFVNNQQLRAHVDLTSGDNVTFGVFHSKFSVLHQKLVVCSSCLDSAGKTSLTQTLQGLGGKLVNTWTQDCTHLTMPTVKVTVKTISALLCCRPIVKPEFFSELNNAVQQKSPPPKPESFIPEIDEPSLNKEDVNLGAIPVRTQLFSGKTFIFLNAKQLKRLSVAVSFGGGTSQLLEEGSLPCDLLESPHSCVVDVTTGTSQAVPSSSSVKWADSVRSILQRKGRRFLPESEIGLAAIYASCDKYCNPSCAMTDSNSMPKVKPRIPSASLSQTVAVDETVMAAASQNITAYAANTEQSQRMEVCEMTGVAAVGETPENKPVQDSSNLHGPKRTSQTMTRCAVADTVNSSFNTADSRHSQRKKLNSEVAGGEGTGTRPQPSASKTTGGTKTFPYQQSPQKPKTFAQTSPQKQSTLTNFFQPVNKKRPLEDELSAVMPEPKRPPAKPSITVQASNTPNTSKGVPSHPLCGPPAVSQTQAESSDLFVGCSETQPKEVQSRKRKEMVAEMKIEELESIMSVDMDCFDDESSGYQGQQEKPAVHSWAKQKQGHNTVDPSRKRQRVHLEENGSSEQKPQMGPEGKSSFKKNHSERSEQGIVSIKTEPGHPTEYMTANHEPSKPPEMSSASTSKNIQPLEDDDGSLIEDVEFLKVDFCQLGDETKAPHKPVRVKQEDQEVKIDEELPQKLVLVEFRSLTVAAPPKTKPKQIQENGHVKNFKCFRKKRVSDADGFPHIIGGSDLFVHNRGQNSDLDEWLKDAAEEERQNRRDESVGDDLFRYNPTKLTKRR